MELPRNHFKHAIAEGKRQIGFWLSMGSPTVAELVAGAGYDWVLIDTEHSPNEVPDVIDQLRALEGGTATPVVRPAWNDPVLIKRLLDAGAQTLLVPFVRNPEEATRAVKAMRYPPDGIRGVATITRASRHGRVADYARKAQDELCLIVQLQTRASLAEAHVVVPGGDPGRGGRRRRGGLARPAPPPRPAAHQGVTERHRRRPRRGADPRHPGQPAPSSQRHPGLAQPRQRLRLPRPPI